MSTSPLPQTGRPAAERRTMRRLQHAAISVFAAVLGVSIGPALLMVADRTTTLHWANFILDLVGGK